ncbi:hypothetical protein [Gloeocapsa sp. PCC 73106]|uniref:hypothetical protein n=1 Tax=Gloeocapsa sp. PCC 73106 TaxID=102232 RepID=UPI00130D5C72|nr:hypothetical protein [Gloeocapsa sp. PCC 73106]
MLELHYKIDQLYRMIEVLSNQIETLLVKDNPQPKTWQIKPTASSLSPNPLENEPTKAQITGHKDILDDSQSVRENYQLPDLENLLSPDVQIQRLTAQLTAAYHRIAALEDQLLATRSHANDAFDRTL